MISRAVIIDRNKILLIHRFNQGKEYFALPGGHSEENESKEETLIREMKEETNLSIIIDKKLWALKNPSDNSMHYFFLVRNFSGKMKLGGEEAEKNSSKNNYILEWHDLDELPKLNLLPGSAKKKIINYFK
jgi:ADP-ribose pyrophosphatase YjhB (NUDIX family)